MEAIMFQKLHVCLLSFFLGGCMAAGKPFVTNNAYVVCERGGKIVLNGPIDPVYQLVYVDHHYEMRIRGKSKRVAIYDTCTIEVIVENPSVMPKGSSNAAVKRP